jgi:predicted RNase H-like nuclease (RuvC/YqgF family)
MDKFTMVIVNLQQLVKQDGWKFSDIIDALNLEELGGWYSGIVVGFLLLLALTERNTPRTSSSAAATAASYSTRAATSAGDAELRSMVTDLNKAVQALTQELKEMKAEKSLTDSALASMKTEVSGMKSQLAQSSATEMQLKKEIEKREADNVALRLKLSETNKEVVNLIEENVCAKACFS